MTRMDYLSGSGIRTKIKKEIELDNILSSFPENIQEKIREEIKNHEYCTTCVSKVLEKYKK